MTVRHIGAPFALTESATVDALAKLATLAHNRAFASAEWREYGGSAEQWRWLRGQGYVACELRRWYPTALGWAAIDALDAK